MVRIGRVQVQTWGLANRIKSFASRLTVTAALEVYPQRREGMLSSAFHTSVHPLMDFYFGRILACNMNLRFFRQIKITLLLP